MSKTTTTQVPRLLAVRQVAELLAVDRSTVWRMRAAGELPEPVRLGGPASRKVRWRADELAHWIATGCPRPARIGGRR